MCGRYALAYDSDDIAAQFKPYHLEVHPCYTKDEHHSKSYNVAPTTNGAVYRTKDQELRYMKWGLVPHWTDDISQFKTYRTFNARLENLQESRMWIQCCNKKRCVVPISGYYEWKTEGKAKYPYYIKRKDDKLMFLAGMYDYLEKKDLWTYTIITGKAPRELSWLHARMPVVLEPNSESWDSWMDSEKVDWTQKELDKMLVARYNDEILTAFRVSEDVGKVQLNDEYLIKPIYKMDRTKNETEVKSTGNPELKMALKEEPPKGQDKNTSKRRHSAKEETSSESCSNIKKENETIEETNRGVRKTPEPTRERKGLGTSFNVKKDGGFVKPKYEHHEKFEECTEQVGRPAEEEKQEHSEEDEQLNGEESPIKEEELFYEPVKYRTHDARKKHESMKKDDTNTGRDTSHEETKNKRDIKHMLSSQSKKVTNKRQHI